MLKIFKFFTFLFLFLVIVALGLYLYSPTTDQPVWGISFSIPRASYLGFDWKIMYQDILDELHPQVIRTMSYWELIEPNKGQYYFEDLDFVLREAQTRDTKTVVVLGYKQPGWPECHMPEWTSTLSVKERDQEVLSMVEAAVRHFRQFDNISAWQIENEPYFLFGPECPTVSKNFYQQELAIVKKYDSRPVIVTDSGEKGAWLPVAASGGDVFGSTVYRTIYHDKKEKYITYPIPPALYRIRAGLTRLLTGKDEFRSVEVQAEPWFETDVYQTPLTRQLELMNLEQFRENVQYAEDIGFSENYFWGAEWWYWLKEQGHDEIWNEAKELFQTSVSTK